MVVPMSLVVSGSGFHGSACLWHGVQVMTWGIGLIMGLVMELESPGGDTPGSPVCSRALTGHV